MSIRGILFDAGDTLYGPIGGRWNPRFDFEEVLLRYHPEVPVDRFTEAIAAGKRFMDAAPSTPPRDDYHRAILSRLGIHDPSHDLLTDLNRPLDVPVVEVFPEVTRVLAELRERDIRLAIVSDNWSGLEEAFVDLGLRQFFDASGQITDIRVIRGLPDGLTRRAIHAVQQIRFEPATIDGMPFNMPGKMELNFNLAPADGIAREL